MAKKGSGSIHGIVQEFVSRLSSLIEQDAVVRARSVVLSAFGVGSPGAGRRGPGRPPGPGVKSADGRRKRRKGPIQLCPVPGCTNRAAPVFGMVCSKHKDLPKSEIRKFREARRAKRDKGKGGTAGRAKALRKPVRRKARAARSAPRSATPPAAKAAATA